MKRNEILEIIIKEADRIAKNHDVELFDVSISTKGKSTVLSVKITGKEIDHEDCHRVHLELDEFLDELDPFPDTYYLEVASPGLDAHLDSDMALSHSIGREVYVKTYVATDEWPKTLIGILKSFDKDQVQIESDSKTYNIERKMISTIRLHFQF